VPHLGHNSPGPAAPGPGPGPSEPGPGQSGPGPVPVPGMPVAGDEAEAWRPDGLPPAGP